MDTLKYLSLLMLAAGLAGCGNYPKNPPQIEAELTRQFIDKPANEFFEMYGQPAGDFIHDDGSTVYRWVSLREPGKVIFTRYHTYGGSYDIVDTYDGQARTHDCELRIYTDPDNIIRRFRVAIDTVGRFGSSRCTEIFG